MDEAGWRIDGVHAGLQTLASLQIALRAAIQAKRARVSGPSHGADSCDSETRA
jgi:hypothetical protein